MPEQNTTPLQKVLEQACAFAALHGVEAELTPADFALQRSPAGVTHATHVCADAVVVAVVRPGEDPVFGLAEPDWIHYPETGGDECGECGPLYPPPRPMTDVYLPGDAPAAAAPVDPPYAAGRENSLAVGGTYGWEDGNGVVHIEVRDHRAADPVDRARRALDAIAACVPAVEELGRHG